jgi:hypothetical protein
VASRGLRATWARDGTMALCHSPLRHLSHENQVDARGPRIQRTDPEERGLLERHHEKKGGGDGPYAGAGIV